MLVEKFYAQLVADRAWLEREVFSSPPTDWAGFRERWGRWVAVNDMIATIENLQKEEEHDDKRK